jgi:hypothetical protein
MDDKDIFHEAVADQGGRLDTGSLHPATAEGLSYAARRARGFLKAAAEARPGMPAIHFDFIDNWEFNASAFLVDGKYFIGVHRGAVATLGVLFDRMLADPRVLPFVGDSDGEAPDLPHLPNIGTDFARTIASVPPFTRPRDPSRQSVAGKLMDTAFDFAVAHEFAHIANGHLDYIAARQGIAAIDELGEVGDDPDAALLSQTMEMDADGTAARVSLGSEWAKIAGVSPRPGPPWNEVYDYPGIISLLWSYAVSALFRTFGDARLTVPDAALENYPSPRLRSAMVQLETAWAPRPEGLTHPSLVGDAHHGIPMPMKAAYLDVEKIFSILTGMPEAPEGANDAWGSVGKSQMQRLRDFWDTRLKAELAAFAHQPLTSYTDRGSGIVEGT